MTLSAIGAKARLHMIGLNCGFERFVMAGVAIDRCVHKARTCTRRAVALITVKCAMATVERETGQLVLFELR